MTNQPLVSVIIPAYGTEGYIDKCLKSVINQTYSNLQIIVIDDGSPDELYKVVEKYELIDDRVELVRQQNGGASVARNNGLKKASGDYILFLDSDDWLEVDTIELLLNKAIVDKADLVMPDRYNKIYENGNKIEELLFKSSEFKTVPEFVINVLVSQGRAWRVSSVLYKADIIKRFKIEFPVGYTSEDMIFNLEYLAKASRISFIKYPTLNVNKRDNSVTATYKDNLLDIVLFIDRKVKEFINKTNYDVLYGNLAVDSLLCRNIILLINAEMSFKNKKKTVDKIKFINKVLSIKRVKEAFSQNKFITPYWNSKIKIYYVIIMRLLIKYKLKFIAITLAFISNKFQ